MNADQYPVLLEKAFQFWSDVGKKNGWRLTRTQGVTVWIDGRSKEMTDSLYNNKENDGQSYIVNGSRNIIARYEWKNGAWVKA